MYVGRFVVVGPEVGAYRVSSRSFPEPRDNRSRRGAHRRSHRGRPETDNPYVSYNCLRVVETPTGETAAFGNGSHVDPIAEKLEVGYPARDALAERERWRWTTRRTTTTRLESRRRSVATAARR